MISPTAAPAEPASCPGFEPVEGDTGYRRRPENDQSDEPTRCEGRYQRKVTGHALELRSFAQGPPVHPDAGELRIWWRETGALRLRGLAYTPRDYYRLDASKAVSPFRWPTAVARQSGVEIDRVGFVGFISEESCPRVVPLRFGEESSVELSATEPRAPYYIWIASLSRVVSVTHRIYPVVDGVRGDMLPGTEHFKRHPEASVREPIRFEVPAPLEPGDYEIDFQFVFRCLASITLSGLATIMMAG